MAFGTYVVLAGLSLGLQGRFSPEAINWLFMKGLVGWIHFCGFVRGYLGEDFMELFLLLFDALGWSMHGDIPGENNEEGTLCRGEDLRFKQASLSPPLHCPVSVPPSLLAWKDQH
nr:protein YIF1B-like [Ipomoea batatas]